MNNIIKPRHLEITPAIIRGVKASKDLLKQSDCLFSQELSHLGEAIELKGGKVSRVYKVSNGQAEAVLKISSGLYRMTELKREAEILKTMKKSGISHLVPSFSKYEESDNSAHLIMDYIEGKSLREILTEGPSHEDRAELWKRVGESLSKIHSFYQVKNIEYPWLDLQLEIAQITMEQKLLDNEEFKDETPLETLKWLIGNKPKNSTIGLIHGDYRTKNILIVKNMNARVIDWGFVDLGDPYYDLAIIDYYFKDDDDRDHFYQGYSRNRYNKSLIEYYDKLSKFINV